MIPCLYARTHRVHGKASGSCMLALKAALAWLLQRWTELLTLNAFARSVVSFGPTLV